jgi:hypothetical protein
MLLPPLCVIPKTMLLNPLSIDPPPTVVVVALDVIVAVAAAPVGLPIAGKPQGSLAAETHS